MIIGRKIEDLNEEMILETLEHQAKQGVADRGDSIGIGNYRRQFHGLIEF